jgi:hypothetical protein
MRMITTKGRGGGGISTKRANRHIKNNRMNIKANNLLQNQLYTCLPYFWHFADEHCLPGHSEYSNTKKLNV